MTTSKTTTKPEKAEEKVNQPVGAPIAPSSAAPVSRDTLSHQWQENSAAINTNELAGYSTNGTNVLDSIDSPEKKKAREAEAKAREEAAFDTLSEVDYKARTRLDVSHPLYINPSLDHPSKKKVRG